MDINVTSDLCAANTSDVVVIGLPENGEFDSSLQAVDQNLDGALTRLLEREELSGRTAELCEFLAPTGLATERLLIVGLGAAADIDQATAFRAAAAAAKHAATKPRESVAFYFPGDWTQSLQRAAVCGAVVGCQGQDLYRSERRLHPPAHMEWHGFAPQALAQGQILGDNVNRVRHWVNASPGIVTPQGFVDEIEPLCQQFGVDIEVWDESRLTEERCGALLGVARAAANPARLAILKYSASNASSDKLALVGKGVTFDSGGLSLKPSDGMKTMKCDMAGAATVVGAILATAQLKLPVDVVGVVGLVENMIGGNAYKLGEVLTARNGKTIEVLNTDAEGRLVLADALNVALDQQPNRLMTLATLTGACIVALGTDIAGIMTNDQTWCDTLMASARESGEAVWQLPMFKEFDDQIKSDVADIKNIGAGRWGGAITAAKFLEQFVDDKPWVHIDIAGPSFLEKPKPWLDAGASGVMLRTIVTLMDEPST